VRFVDTDILLYGISRDPEEQDKAARANDILTARDTAERPGCQDWSSDPTASGNCDVRSRSP
jgi:hypothetical protein